MESTLHGNDGLFVVPLRLHRPTRGDEQQLVDKIAGHLASWKRKLLNRDGRLALVNAVLSNMSVYYMTSNSLSNWAVSKIEKIRQNFLYMGDDLGTRPHCPVNWSRNCRTKNLGGMGIKNLEYLNRALRFRWLWQRWVHYDKPWDMGTLSFAIFWNRTKTIPDMHFDSNWKRSENQVLEWPLVTRSISARNRPDLFQIGMSQEYDSGACFVVNLEE